MAYRFTNTDKWEKDGWFIDLKPTEKLLFIYLYETCDIAGFKEISTRKISFDVCFDEDKVKGALEGIQRGILWSNDKSTIFMRNFIKQQKNLPLNPNNPAHKLIIKLLTQRLDLFDFTDINQFVNHKNTDAPLEGLPCPAGKGKGNG